MKKILLLSAACFVFSGSVWAEETPEAVPVEPVMEEKSEQAEAQAVALEEDAKQVAEEVVAVEEPAVEEAVPVEPEVTEPQYADWGYGASDGAHRWGDLDPAFAACKDGMKQSPINIDKFLQEDLPPIISGYKDAPLQVMNNGKTVKVNFTDAGGFRADNTNYDLKHLHFHTPSEHYLDGAPYPMEVHFVHKSKDGAYAVIAVMLKVGEHNPVVEGVWQNVPAVGETKDVLNVSINAAALMPEVKDYYKYDGSLTHPPCTEGVVWHVMKDPVELSAKQLKAFQAVFPINARPIQPLNERVVTGG